MLVILRKYDETSPVYCKNMEHLHPKMSSSSLKKRPVDRAGSPTRAPFAATWPRALLTFPPRDREELDNKKIKFVKYQENQQERVPWKFSNLCSQKTGEIVISIVWLSPQLDMFTILWGSHIVMDAYFPSVMIIRHWRITIFGIMERVIILGIIIVTPKRSKQIEKRCITTWDVQTSIFLGLLYHKYP
jgi:hypothetical protein